MTEEILVLCSSSRQFIDWATHYVQGVDKRLYKSHLRLKVGNCNYRCLIEDQDINKIRGIHYHSFIHIGGYFSEETLKIIISCLRGKVNDKTNY